MPRMKTKRVWETTIDGNGEQMAQREGVAIHFIDYLRSFVTARKIIWQKKPKEKRPWKKGLLSKGLQLLLEETGDQ